MDKDLAGQDAKNLYDVSGLAGGPQLILSLFKNLLALFYANISLCHESGSYLRNKYDL